jgi:hypothetical protein
MICGGGPSNDQSDCLADEIVRSLKREGINIEIITDKISCGIKPDGTWWAE